MVKKEPTLELQRKLLASINLSDLENKEETEQERKDYCAAIFAVFPRLEKDIKRFLYEQLIFSSNEAETWEQVIFGRGTFNGLKLLLEYWDVAAKEHVTNSNKEEKFDLNSPLAEI